MTIKELTNEVIKNVKKKLQVTTVKYILKLNIKLELLKTLMPVVCPVII